MGEQVETKLVYRLGRIEAVRYGDVVEGTYDPGAPARIAQFVLGHPVDARVSSLNESLLSVVQPVDEFWDPENGVADIIVTDNNTGVRMSLGLGQWLTRYPSKILRPMSHNQMIASHLPPPPSESFEAELTKLLTKHGREKGSGTPSVVLADHISEYLSLYNKAIRRRASSRGETVN